MQVFPARYLNFGKLHLINGAPFIIYRLRDLVDPIIPHALYDYCIKNAENTDETLLILDMIPEHNRNVLLYLISFLQVIGEPQNQAATKMNINNLAMVFAPNILRCPSENLQVYYNQIE